MFTEIPFHLTMDTIHLLSINLAPVAAVSPFRPPVPTMATSPTDETDPMSNRYIPRAARAVPHEEVVHTIEFRKITYPLTDRPAELWIVETNHRGHKSWRTLERFLDDFAISPLGAPPDYAMASCAHLEALAASNGENITVFLIPFPTEVHLKYKNFDGTYYLRPLTPTPPTKAHIRLFPTINHYFELVGEGLPFAILKAIQHPVYLSPTLSQYYTHHLQQLRLLLRDLRLQTQLPEGNGLLSHRYLRLHPGTQLHLWTNEIPADREKEQTSPLLSHV